MQAIDKSAVIDYQVPQNILAAVVAFLYAGGSGYTSAPTVTFSGGGGSGAAGTAVITNGRVTGITITSPGSSYTSAPTIAFSGGGGTGAAATAVLSGATVASATITSGGTGRTITVTDNTVYPSGDSRANVLVTVADRFNKRKEYNIGISPGNRTIDLLADGFNDVDGIDMLVTVVSAKRKTKDGSVYGVGVGKPTGNFTIEA